MPRRRWTAFAPRGQRPGPSGAFGRKTQRQAAAGPCKEKRAFPRPSRHKGTLLFLFKNNSRATEQLDLEAHAFQLFRKVRRFGHDAPMTATTVWSAMTTVAGSLRPKGKGKGEREGRGVLARFFSGRVPYVCMFEKQDMKKSFLFLWLIVKSSWTLE